MINAFFDGWSIVRRIGVGFGVVLALVAGLGAFSVEGMLRLSSTFAAYDRAADQTLALDELVTDLFEARLAAQAYQAAPTDAGAEAFNARIAQMHESAARAQDAFSGVPDAHAKLEAVLDGADAYAGAFLEAGAKRVEAEAMIAEAAELGAAFERGVNGMLFSARISGDNGTVGHGNAAIQAYIRASGAFQTFLLTSDRASLDASTSKLAEARSALDSAASQLEIRGANADSARGAIETLDAYRALSLRIAEALEARATFLAERFEPLGLSIQATLAEAAASVVDRQRALGEGAADANLRQTTMLITLAIVAVLVGAALAILIGRAIGRAVGRMADQMTRIAEGDRSVQVVGSARAHELGRMARALGVFKENAERIDQLAQERAQAEDAAEADRRRMMTELREAFGGVVEAARDGDFSKRVETRFPDAELNTLASGLNALVETVEQGLAEMSRVVGRMSEGDLGERMNGAFKGAFASLQTDVNETLSRLSDLIASIVATSAKVRDGAQSISRDGASLAERAERQAASLEETAATTEEMSSTVKENAASAEQASRMAADASERAEAGGAIVTQAMSAMGEIEGGASKIAEIITVIDGIAFQTNLLALNAAVEAARAGDAGKGFAVVASEVRALAQRAGDAARDIRELIQASSAQVDQGAKLVQDAGGALSEIVDEIKRVETTVREIAAACGEQATGVAGISSAIHHMDELTQENTRMADGSARSANALTDEAGRLEELVGRFEIDAAAASARSAA